MTISVLSRASRSTAHLFLVLACVSWVSGPSCAEVFVLQNGMRVRGLFTKIPSISGDLFSGSGSGGGVDLNQIIVVDDGLRRVFFSTHQKADLQAELETLELIRLQQPVATSPASMGQIGSLLKPPEPFNDHGRRRITMASAKGPLEFIQGITEITPVFTRLQTLQSARAYDWDLRISTSSIPRDTLSRILKTHLSHDDVDDRLSIVRLFLQSKRYEDAAQELEAVIADFPDQAELQDQLVELRRLHAQQIFAELSRRQAAGQHEYVKSLLKSFSSNLPADILLQAAEMNQFYEHTASRRATSLGRLELLASELKDGAIKSMMESLIDELRGDLNDNTIDRLNDFERLADDPQLNGEQKAALALSGWLTGGFAVDNLPLASSLWRMRDLTRQYINAAHAVQREELLKEMGSEEANTPDHVAHLLAAMKPPMCPISASDDKVDPSTSDAKEAVDLQSTNSVDGDVDADSSPVPGFHEFEIEGLGDGSPIRYLVQLPPEYDPHRRYPTIVTLHAAKSTAELQIDWWAGAYDRERSMRMGQATRHGYIVIAPEWSEEGQRRYNYSAAEHAAILFCLRDAFQRFSIDTDKVFLSGHALGGDAAWDIALAHPDLWAGAILISATGTYDTPRAPKYVSQYWENAKQVPLYFVQGERDFRRLKANARDLNRYLKKPGFDTMFVEYLGHGSESFYEEIQTLFEWMELHRRNLFVDEFQVVTMRPWDNFFWWAEVSQLPTGSMVLPAAWPERGVPRPTQIEGSIRERKNVMLNTGSSAATIYLAPDQVDFANNVTVSVNGKSRARNIKPDVHVLLEDARRRGDRLRPFWAQVDVETGRRNR